VDIEQLSSGKLPDVCQLHFAVGCATVWRETQANPAFHKALLRLVSQSDAMAE
jgi:hypothetical protein